MPQSPQDEEVVRDLAQWKNSRRAAAPVEAGLSAQDTYAELMKTAFAPFLRERGFRGSSGRFELPSATHWAQLGFQKSAYGDRLELRFTINLSFISRGEWAQKRGGSPHLGAKPAPSTFYGSWADQKRIGGLTPQAEDKWWHIVGNSDVIPVRDDVLADLDAYAMPWFRARLAA